MDLNKSRVLVTGADGFIGSHLTEMLVDQGVSVRALVQYNSLNSWGWLDNLQCLDNVEVISGDIRDANFTSMICKGVDVVIHLAALIAIPYSYVAPHSYVETNVIGTLNILQSAVTYNVKRFIHTSTSEVYGTARVVPIDESHPLQPQSPYSATKIAADSIALSYFHSFGLPVTIARPFNTYGPRQSARAIIPTVITQILSGQRFLKLGSISPTRDFNFVEDTCRGLIALAECDGALGQAINIGSGIEISIGRLVDMIQNILGSDIQIVTDDARIRPATSEVERLVCDNFKIYSLTGFLPRYDLAQGLEKTIQWFKSGDNIRRYRAYIYNV